jgi:hypothetical protein
MELLVAEERRPWNCGVLGGLGLEQEPLAGRIQVSGSALAFFGGVDFYLQRSYPPGSVLLDSSVSLASGGAALVIPCHCNLQTLTSQEGEETKQAELLRAEAGEDSMTERAAAVFEMLSPCSCLLSCNCFAFLR